VVTVSVGAGVALPASEHAPDRLIAVADRAL
jgi:hypothetical protein